MKVNVGTKVVWWSDNIEDEVGQSWDDLVVTLDNKSVLYSHRGGDWTNTLPSAKLGQRIETTIGLLPKKMSEAILANWR